MRRTIKLRERRTLQIRNVKPATAEDTVPVLNGTFLSPELLTSIVGIGKTVVSRITDLAGGTVEGFYATYGGSAESLAEQIKGLSEAGAAKVIEKINDKHGNQPKPKETEVLSEVENPFPGLDINQLKSILPNLDETKAASVRAYLDTLEPPWEEEEQEEEEQEEEQEEEEEEQEEELPAPYDALTIPALLAIWHTIADANHKELVRKFLVGNGHDLQDSTTQTATPNNTTETVSVTKNDTKKKTANSAVERFRQRRNTTRNSGSSFNYHKLGSGKNILRVLGDFDTFRLHTYHIDGRITSSLDLKWLLTRQDLCSILTKDGRLTDGDIVAIQQYGDPFNYVGFKLHEAGAKDEAKSLWARNRYMFNVLPEGDDEVKILETSESLAENFAAFNKDGEFVGGLLEEYPDLFDIHKGSSINIQGNGQDKFQRRYTSVTVRRTTPPIKNPEDLKLYSLTDVILAKYTPFDVKASHLLKAFGDLAEEVGVGPEILGTAREFNND